jgi:polar amino acid transport system substrate-binding protein
MYNTTKENNMMKQMVNTVQSPIVRIWSLQAGILFMIMICCVVSAFGQEEQITTIHIVTPAWEDWTNEDGTGVYFELVRAVYEPVGITMTYEILPWKRARAKVIAGEADAILSNYDDDDMLMPRYPLDVERTAVVFNKDTIPNWEGVASFEGKKFVWLRGYDYHVDTDLEGLQYKWYEVDEYAQAWSMLEKGRVEFYMDALGDIEAYIEAHAVEMTPYRVETVWTDNAYIALTKSARGAQLAEMYDQRIPELLASGTLQQIFEAWDAELPPFEPEDE